MLHDGEIKILELIEIVRKQDDATIRESKKLTAAIANLTNITHYIREKKVVRLTPSQKQFVHIVLHHYIMNDIPKLDDVLKVYDLDMNDIYYYSGFDDISYYCTPPT